MSPIRSCLLVAVWFLLACVRSAHADITIGWIGPLTGNAAVLGIDSVPAIQMAIDQVNATGGIAGEKLVLAVEDDQYITAKTVAAYNHLTRNRGARVIFVLTYGGLAAVAPKAERDGVILINTLDADEETAKLPGNTFCIAKTTESMGRKLAELILLKNDLPLALLYFDGDPFMGILAKALLAELALHDKRPLITETYNGQTADFRDFATKVKSRGVRSVALLGYDTLGLAARNLRDIGSRAQFYGVNTATSPGFRELAGDSIKGMFGLAFIAPRNDALKKFEDEFKSRVGRVWRFETSTISSYDAMTLVARSVAESGGLSRNESGAAVISTDRLRERLLSVKGYQGLSGVITIDPDGITRSLDVRAVEFGVDGVVRVL